MHFQVGLGDDEFEVWVRGMGKIAMKRLQQQHQREQWTHLEVQFATGATKGSL